MKSGITKTIDNLPKLMGKLDELTRTDVLVGVPRDKTARQDGQMNNATLAYIHDNGSPARNIPARPFMRPGIEAAKGKIVAQYKIIAKSALSKDASALSVGLNRIGLIAQASVRGVINAGIAPPLSLGTLRARARRGRKGAIEEIAARKAGAEATMTNAKPLIDTGQLRNSITYVIRKK